MLTWQIYSFTRVVTLVLVALNLYNIDTTTQINCQVRATSFLTSFLPASLTDHVLQVLMSSQFVCTPSHPNLRGRISKPRFSQILAYLALAASSLLIVLRVYVFRYCSPYKAYRHRQNCHLG